MDGRPPHSNLSAARYVITNRNFEETISVSRNNIEDDQYGIYAPRLEKMGFDVAQHPDNLVFGLLKKGFTTKCFDDQYFFDADHKGYDENKAEIAVSNMAAGEGPAWYLLDCGQPLKPLIYQERRPFDFVSLDSPTDANVFWRNEHIYGVDGRSNAGYGLWQLAYGSKAVLNEANYVAATHGHGVAAAGERSTARRHADPSCCPFRPGSDGAQVDQRTADRRRRQQHLGQLGRINRDSLRDVANLAPWGSIHPREHGANRPGLLLAELGRPGRP